MTNNILKDPDIDLASFGIQVSPNLGTGETQQTPAERIDQLLTLAAGKRERVGELLRSAGRITEDDLTQALAKQKQSGHMLGDVLTEMGLLTPRERDVVIEFQQRQGSRSPQASKLYLGKLLVKAGLITEPQLSDSLKRQAVDGGALGDVLVSAGHATPKQIAQGLQLQKKLVGAALVAALQLAPLAETVPSAYAAHMNASVQVTVNVIANAKLQTNYQLDRLVVTDADITRGYIDVPSASSFSVVTNDPSGYLADFIPVGDVFQSVEIKGLAGTVQLDADGGTVVQRGISLSKIERKLSYHFVLRQGIAPGTYSWPLALSVRALSNV